MERYKLTTEAPPEEAHEFLINIVGTAAESRETALEKYGTYIAERVVTAIQEAQHNNKKLVLDAATGSTPKPVWPALKKLVETKRIDLSSVIIIGHEEGWGTYEPGSQSDFDAYRKRILEDLNVPVREIRTTDAVSKKVFDGNFVPMHLREVRRDDFEQGSKGDEDFFLAEQNAAMESAQTYDEILKALRSREDVTFFGLYGVGTDGHIGEMQVDQMGIERSRERKSSFAEPDTEHPYSVEGGFFYWQDQGDSFHPESNIFWERGTKLGESVGRAVWQNYTGVHQMIGIGWRDMLAEDDMIIAFNDVGKSLAFQLALEGSLTGKIVDAQNQAVQRVEREKGEGEAIFFDLWKYALEIEREGLLTFGETEKAAGEAGKLKCGVIFKKIYEALDRNEAPSGDPHYREMWKFANRYIGKRAPVARLIRMRSLLGKKTELVATPEVVVGTRYQALTK